MQMYDKFFADPIDEGSDLYYKICEYSRSSEGRAMEEFLGWWYMFVLDLPYYSGKGEIEPMAPTLWIVAPQYGGIVAVLRECISRKTPWDKLLGIDLAHIFCTNMAEIHGITLDEDSVRKDFASPPEDLRRTSFVELYPEIYKDLPPLDSPKEDILRWFHNLHKEP